MANESLRDRILGCQSVPTLPAVALHLLEITRDPNCPLEEIARVVKADQGIASKILRTINSSYYSLSTPCGTIERSLALLGLNTVKSLALGFSLVTAAGRVGAESGIDMESFWARAIYSAAAARQIAGLAGRCDPDEAFTAGLFQDIGMLAIAAGAREVYVDAPHGPGSDHERLPAHERKSLNLDHSQIGGDLARKWKLPDELTCCIRYHHDPEGAPSGHEGLVRIVWLGRYVAAALRGEGEEGKQALTEANTKAKAWFGLSPEQVQGLLEPVVEDAKELSAQFEQEIGAEPDLVSLLAEANERLTRQQIESSLEASRLREESLTDGLTGVGNRRSFDAELCRAWGEGLGKGTPVAVLFLDADRFKSVNDAHGHQAGDAVLVELSGRARGVVGGEGGVFRYGGEEFAIILPGLDEARAREVAERLRAAVAESPFDLSGVEASPDALAVTVSVGVASFVPGAGGSAEDLVHRADECVYEAKRRGRNRVCAATDVAAAGEPPGGATGTPCRSPDEAPRVLLVEDDALAAKLLELLLRKGARAGMIWLNTGEAARAHIDKVAAGEIDPPDVIIADLNLPDVDGLEIVETVRRVPALSEVPVLVVSASSGDGVRAKCLRAGATDFASKDQVAQNVSDWVRRIGRMGLKAA